LGADYKSFEHKNSIQKKYDNKSVFLTNSNEFNILEGRTIITESLRFDDYDQFDDKTTGKLGVKHFCNTVEGVSLSANIGSSYNVPTLTNLYHPTWGNPDIKPESTLSYDIGAQYKDLKLTYFNSTTQDMIEYDFGTSSYNNIEGDVEIQGIEVEYNSKLNDDFSMTSSYTWLDARNSDDEVLRRRPKNTLNLALDYYGVKNLHVGINGEYIGERYSNDNENGTQTGKYTVVNLVTNYSLNKNLSIYAKIENLFDKYYQVLDGYATAPLSAYAGIKAQF
jgi:vitamin B12 transporter